MRARARGQALPHGHEAHVGHQELHQVMMESFSHARE